jgi:putative DNA primase/helicase
MAEQALVLLATLLEEFPFVDLGAEADGHISRAVALSALITLAVRPSMDIVPMHVISAADAGTGKGYLLDIAAAISVGRTCPVIAASTSAEEREKKITAKLLDGSQILNLDNINGEMGGDLLCQTVTQKTLELRPLGTSTNVSIENRVTTFANGNNIRVSGDMVRRVLLCYMNANVERPELRKFKGWPFEAVLADRGKYLSACLMIPMAYNAAGMPGRLPPIASFVEWSDKVRSALVWLGCADPATSMERVRADDPVINEIGEVMQAWADAFGGEGHTVAELVALAGSRVAGTPDSPAMPNKRPELWELLNRLFGERGVINTKRLGKWLRDKEGRVVGDRCFVRRAGSTRNGAVRWALEATR